MKISRIILLIMLCMLLIGGLVFVFGENTRQINDLNLTSNYNYLIPQEDNDSVVYTNIFNTSESFTVRKSTVGIINNSTVSIVDNGINSIKDNSIIDTIDSSLGGISNYVPDSISNTISNKINETINNTVSTTLSERNIRENFNNYIKNSEEIKLNNNMTLYYSNYSVGSVTTHYYYFTVNGNYYEIFSLFKMSDELLNDLLKNNRV
ncbi:MAG: hypothetical protein ACRCVG_00155 [Methanobacteriaceae archaeon]